MQTMAKCHSGGIDGCMLENQGKTARHLGLIERVVYAELPGLVTKAKALCVETYLPYNAG